MLRLPRILMTGLTVFAALVLATSVFLETRELELLLRRPIITNLISGSVGFCVAALFVSVVFRRVIMRERYGESAYSIHRLARVFDHHVNRFTAQIPDGFFIAGHNPGTESKLLVGRDESRHLMALDALSELLLEFDADDVATLEPDEAQKLSIAVDEMHVLMETVVPKLVTLLDLSAEIGMFARLDEVDDGVRELRDGLASGELRRALLGRVLKDEIVYALAMFVNRLPANEIFRMAQQHRWHLEKLHHTIAKHAANAERHRAAADAYRRERDEHLDRARMRWRKAFRGSPD